MEHLFVAHDAAETGIRAWANRSVLLPVLTIGRGNIMQMCRVKTFTVIEQEVAELGLADAQGVREHRLEYWLHVAG